MKTSSLPPQVRARAPATGLPEGHRLRVLIAERHRTVAEALEKVIQALGLAEAPIIATTATETTEYGRRIEPDVAIVDLDLSPSCSLISGLHAVIPDARIVAMVDRSTEMSLVLRALESGAVGALYKDTSIEELSRAVTSSSKTAPVLPGEASGLLLTMHLEALQGKRDRDVATIETLAAAVEVRDATTGDHLQRVTALATDCMRHIDPALALNEELSYGFLLHDIGKIGIPDAILNKPAALTDDEWSVMRKHPEIGVKIVDPLGFSSTTTDVILCHHERWDGSGYPNGLRGDETPIGARAFAIADAYDAMTSDRPYRSAMSPEQTVETIRDLSGSAYDPDLVDIFVDALV